MQNRYLQYSLLFFLFLYGGILSATHIVGGEVLYKHLGNDRYAVRLNLFVDCLNGSPLAIADDATAYFYVFRKNTGALLPGFPISVARSIPERLVKLHYNCLANAPNACVDFYVYDTTLHLPSGIGGYVVSFQRCCRNNSITNLLNPGAQGANYWTTIPDTSDIPDHIQNTSADFRQLPPNFLCTNAFLNFDHSAEDADGDSLVYELFWPYHGATANKPRPDNGANGLPQSPPFPHITWLNPYSEDNPIDGGPPLKIDRQTGKLTLTPTRTGQYVAGIRVLEYRNGILIAETKRDYQFNVSDCDLTLLAGPGGDQRRCDDQITLKNYSYGAQRYSWDFGIDGRTDDTSNLRDPVFQFPDRGVFKVKLKVFKNNCEDSAESEIRIGKKVSGTATLSTDNCTKKVDLFAESDAPVTEWILDGEVVHSKTVNARLETGQHLARAVFIDTIAGCNDTLDKPFELTEEVSDLRLANCFTPDDDGINDCYRVLGDAGNCAIGRLKIFNRWGELVFETDELTECWNGRVNNAGAYLPAGAYFYILDIQIDTQETKKSTISGAVQLIK